jgi:hypothetical protein
MILAGIISFLDTMDTSEYLPIVIEILVYFSENYQNIFGQRFNVNLFVIIIYFPIIDISILYRILLIY